MHHHLIDLPKADVLVHCGDAMNWGSYDEMAIFFNWFTNTPYTYRIFIAGNHDIQLQKIGKQLPDWVYPDKFHFLWDSGVTIEGIKFYGSPWVTTINGRWAFEQNEFELERHFIRIPGDTDVLITHGPPYGILNDVYGRHIGSQALRTRVEKLRPRYHFFGHCHEDFGAFERVYQDDGRSTVFCNAATAGLNGRHVPVFDINIAKNNDIQENVGSEAEDEPK